VNAAGEPEELTPAERRLSHHLMLLRDATDPPSSLTARVVHSARWQQAVRPPLLAVAHIAAAAADAVRVLLRGGRS
jgi:hypothetical protein